MPITHFDLHYGKSIDTYFITLKCVIGNIVSAAVDIVKFVLNLVTRKNTLKKVFEIYMTYCNNATDANCYQNMHNICKTDMSPIYIFNTTMFHFRP